ncbi:MAG: hypothetical protein ACFCUI_05685 [Bernardetiaceae bacterium]
MKKPWILLLGFLGWASTVAMAQQNLKSFKGTAWYVSEIITYQANKDAEEKKLPPEKNTVSFTNENRYTLNFPDVSGMKAAGFFVEENSTVVLSDLEGKMYSYVFQINKRTEDEVIAVYLPFRPSPQKIILIFKRSIPQVAETKSPTAATADFSGIWKSQADIYGLRLKIEQIGTVLHGVHDAKGTDINRYSVIGEVKDGKAIVELRSQVSHDQIGKAEITKNADGSLAWKVLEGPNAAFLRSRTIDGAKLTRYEDYNN